MQDTGSQLPYQGSRFQKYDAYDDDEAYEMVQEPYELANHHPPAEEQHPNYPVPQPYGLRKDEPSSPTFSNAHHNTAAQPGSTMTTNRTGTNRDSDYMKQMAQKIKKQAEQLHELGNYKSLCEKRIVELVPGHPLPILPIHLGNPGPASEEIAQLQGDLKAKEEEIAYLQNHVQNITKQASARKSLGPNEEQTRRESSLSGSTKLIGGEDVVGSYNILYGKYKALLGEKQALEETLRNETLVNEEQRTYVEILRQMLDEKFDQMNIANLIGGLPEKGKIDAIIEIKSLNDQLAQQQNDLQYYQENIQTRNAEMQKIADELKKMNQKQEELVSENIKLSEANIILSQTTKNYETEFEILKEEKSSLIDFADEQASKYEKLSNEYEEVKKNIETLEEANQTLNSQLNQATTELQDLHEELKRLTNDKEQFEDQAHDLQDQLDAILSERENLTNRHQDIETQLESTEQEKVQTQEELTKLQKENRELTKLRETKEREAQGLSARLDEISAEHAKLKEIYQKKESEFQNKLYKLKSDYEAEIQKLEEQIAGSEESESNMKRIIEKNSSDITKALKQINSYKEKTKKLEAELEEAQSFQETIQAENHELREALNQIEEKNQDTREAELQTSRELKKLREESEKNFYKVTELGNLNSTLEKRLQAKEEEVSEYENMVNESKKRGERDRQSKLDEVRKLCDENNELRRELHGLKENLAKSSTALNLKDEEVTLLKNHLDKKNQQNRTLLDENRLYKQKSEEVEYLQEQLSGVRGEYERNMRGIRDYEDQIENKTATLKNTMNKLETAEQEVFTTLSNFKELQRERADLLAENTRLHKKVEDMKASVENVELQRVDQDEKLAQVTKGYEKAQKELARVTEDLENLSREYDKLNEANDTVREDDNILNVTLKQASESTKDILKRVKQYITIYNEMLVTSPEALLIMGKRFRTLLDSFDGYQFVKDGKEARSMLVRSVDYLKEVTDVLLEEIENLARRVVDLKQDLTIGNQRTTMLERKCINLSTEEADLKQREVELRREIEILKEDRIMLQKDKSSVYTREVKIEKENADLKREVTKLENEVKDLRENLRIDHENMRASTIRERRQIHQEVRSQDLATLEQRYKMAQKEKQGYEEIIQRLCHFFANPELQKLIMDVMKLQTEIDQGEREKYNLELQLSEMETDYKLYIKKAPSLSPSRSSAKRAEIENARTDLNNLQTQLAIIIKRKSILLEELKSFEIYEKRRYETTIETEKSLLDVKRQLQDMRSQNHGLERVNTDLREAVKTISKDKQALDQESLKLRYPSFAEPKEQDNVRTFANNHVERDRIRSYDLTDKSNARGDPKRESNRFEGLRVATGHNELDSEVRQDNWEPRPVGRSFTDRNELRRSDVHNNNYSTDKKDTSYSRYLEHDNSQQKIKLKDRLNQAKHALSSMRKSYDRGETH